jgi:hypothetical protein
MLNAYKIIIPVQMGYVIPLRNSEVYICGD